MVARSSSRDRSKQRNLILLTATLLWTMTEPGVNDEILHEQLKNLIEGSTIPWTCAILWRFRLFRSVLNFESGYYRGTGSKPKELDNLGSCVSVIDAEIKSECFFKLSMKQTFSLGIGEDLFGHAFREQNPVWVSAADTNASTSRSGEMHTWGTWDRPHWARDFGIQTLFCIPLKESKVLELASTKIIPYHPSWIQDTADFINPIGIPRLPIEPLARFRDQYMTEIFLAFRDRGMTEDFLTATIESFPIDTKQLRARTIIDDQAEKEALFLAEKSWIMAKLASATSAEEFEDKWKRIKQPQPSDAIDISYDNDTKSTDIFRNGDMFD